MDCILQIRENELLLGVVDKNQFGASAFGLVHAVYELYGPTTAGTTKTTTTL
jgi:DNA-directed RNA polymerase I subunit RPA1